MGHNGQCQVGKTIKPHADKFPHRKEINTLSELAIALQQAFNHGFDEGSHWAQIRTYE